MNRDGWMLLGGVALGAGMMYMLDPDRGRRRRALVRDQLVSAGNKTSMYTGKISRDLSNRAYGLYAETRSLFRGKEEPDGASLQGSEAAATSH